MIKRRLIFVFGIVTYLLFLSTVLYAIGFVGNVVVPKSIDTGGPSPLFTAVLVDLSLIALFGVQHSVMARQTFKRWLTRHVPQPIERSIYVLFSSLSLVLLFWQWRPVTHHVWIFASDPLNTVLKILSWIGWGLVVSSTFLIDHFDLFGLRQVYCGLRGIAYTPVPFRQPSIYKYVRHPLMLGFLVAFWSTPEMSVGHLIFAAGMTGYIFIGIAFEERDLVRAHGLAYERYRRKVSMLFPMPRRK
jgi:protein-S-isoprenylcysteine O-methyltransferase Ste14